LQSGLANGYVLVGADFQIRPVGSLTPNAGRQRLGTPKKRPDPTRNFRIAKHRLAVDAGGVNGLRFIAAEKNVRHQEALPPCPNLPFPPSL